MNDTCDILSHSKINMHQVIKEEIILVIKNFINMDNILQFNA